MIIKVSWSGGLLLVQTPTNSALFAPELFTDAAQPDLAVADMLKVSAEHGAAIVARCVEFMRERPKQGG